MLSRAAKDAANRIISDAAMRVLRLAGLSSTGEAWLAARAWVMRSSPRPPARRYVLRKMRGHSLPPLATCDPAKLDVPVEDSVVIFDNPILEAVAMGESYRSIASRLGVSPATVARRVARLRREEGAR